MQNKDKCSFCHVVISASISDLKSLLKESPGHQFSKFNSLISNLKQITSPFLASLSHPCSPFLNDDNFDARISELDRQIAKLATERLSLATLQREQQIAKVEEFKNIKYSSSLGESLENSSHLTEEEKHNALIQKALELQRRLK